MIYLAVWIGIMALLFMILKLKLPAFMALLITSILTALCAGMEPLLIMESIKAGMGTTLGFVAIIIGLGSIFGGILEQTGAANVLATFFLNLTGEKFAPLALLLTGFLVSIPIFFDVGIIILLPIVIAVHQRTKKSLVYYALPLLAGLAVSHAFIPPTPGPLAVASLIGAPMDSLVMVSILVGLPSAFIAGNVYGRYLSNKLLITIETKNEGITHEKRRLPSIKLVLPILLFPIILIVLSTALDKEAGIVGIKTVDQILIMLCHPFAALIIANILAWYILGRGHGYSTNELTKISSASLAPSGLIILVTGAGGVFKEILISIGAGKMIAESMQAQGISPIVFAFIAAGLIRVLQGSATVAMITAGGLVSPLLPSFQLSDIELACMVTSIASGATILSHLNDSGFWLVKEYLGVNERQAIQIWTVASTILGLSAFGLTMLVYHFMG
jgi:Gnt-I system low-affinity gluconate transporter